MLARARGAQGHQTCRHLSARWPASPAPDRRGAGNGSATARTGTRWRIVVWWFKRDKKVHWNGWKIWWFIQL